jgi:hypothetical protein
MPISKEIILFWQYKEHGSRPLRSVPAFSRTTGSSINSYACSKHFTHLCMLFFLFYDYVHAPGCRTTGSSIKSYACSKHFTHLCMLFFLFYDYVHAPGVKEAPQISEPYFPGSAICLSRLPHSSSFLKSSSKLIMCDLQHIIQSGRSFFLFPEEKSHSCLAFGVISHSGSV